MNEKEFLMFIKNKLLNFCLVFVCFFLAFFLESKVLDSATFVKFGFPENAVVEHLRVHVPKQLKDSWLKAEKLSWEPWLDNQNGFIGRQLFWDPETEDATLLIIWENRSKWKSIPRSEIESTQELFEMIAREETGKDFGNPFPLVFQGELLPQ